MRTAMMTGCSKALADPTRRHLLDRLFERGGRSLTELESELRMTRFGVMKHLRALEEADLVVAHRAGREKLHYLHAVPIRLIHDRWIDKYTEPSVAAPSDFKARFATHDQLERSPKTARSVARPGWMVVLSGLKTLLETGEPLAA